MSQSVRFSHLDQRNSGRLSAMSDRRIGGHGVISSLSALSGAPHIFVDRVLQQATKPQSLIVFVVGDESSAPVSPCDLAHCLDRDASA